MKKLILFLSIFIVIACNSKKDAIINIIPKPLKTEFASGSFTITEKTAVVCKTDEEKKIGQFLIDALKKLNNVSIAEKESDNDAIILSIQDTIKSLGDEGYRLIVSEKNIEIIAGKPAGLYFGVQSLLQLCSVNEKEKIVLNCLKIEDKPRFSWRGMHLDESRHFHGKELVKKYIDMLAMHKLNIFHWHLVDDQGWRIEIKKYPKLTSIGAWREDRNDERWELSDEQRTPLKEKRAPYGGFYTQEEIKEIIKYAQDRYITIVPEIEMPGHSQAALVAYPEYSCFGRANHVPVGLYTAENWNFSDPYCVGNEKTFKFLEDILTEVIDLFPSQYIHVGGDECRKVRWEECKKCQSRMKKEGLKDVKELQSYLIKRIEKFIVSKNRKLIGWQEILEGGLSPAATVMPWKGDEALEACLESAKQEHGVIMAASNHLYFGGDRPTLEKIYEYEPVPQELTADQKKYIIGVNACAWGEPSVTSEDVEKQVMPSICALSEVAWCYGESKDKADFMKRMKLHYARLAALNINYYLPYPKALPEKEVFIEKAIVSMKNPDSTLLIRYTTDGTNPSVTSSVYNEPFTVQTTTTVKAAVYDNYGHCGDVVSALYEKQDLLNAVTLENKKTGLSFQYFNKRFRSAEEIDKLTPDAKGIVDSVKVVKFNGDKDAGTIYEGYIEVPRDSIYSFYLISKDGSVLWIGDRLVINNDGFTSKKEKLGKVALAKGFHPIKIKYFDWGGGESIKLLIEGPGFIKQEVSSKILFY